MEDGVEAAEEARGVHACLSDERAAQSQSAKCQHNGVGCFCNRSREAGALLGGWLGLEEEGSDVLNAGAHLDHVGDALGLLRRDKIHDERWQISLENQHMTMTRKRRTLRSTQARYSIRHFLGSSFTGRSRNPARMISARTYLADGE